jgi:hypothetical protein
MIAIGKKCNTLVSFCIGRWFDLGRIDPISVTAVIGRYRRAAESVSEARQSFLDLTAAAPPEAVDIWKATIEEAEDIRSESPKAMDVMHSKIRTGRTLKAITAAIMQEDMDARNISPNNIGTVDWLLEGLHIEDEQ